MTESEIEDIIKKIEKIKEEISRSEGEKKKVAEVAKVFFYCVIFGFGIGIFGIVHTSLNWVQILWYASTIPASLGFAMTVFPSLYEFIKHTTQIKKLKENLEETEERKRNLYRELESEKERKKIQKLIESKQQQVETVRQVITQQPTAGQPQFIPPQQTQGGGV